jgi:hypothetical protein
MRFIPLRFIKYVIHSVVLVLFTSFFVPQLMSRSLRTNAPVKRKKQSKNKLTPNPNFLSSSLVQSGTTKYLSDIAWELVFNGWGPVEKDLSNGEQAYRDGRPISLNGVVYSKGLGAHAYSEIVYNLGGNCSSFISDVGIDDEISSGGSVVFEVWADGVKLASSSTMTPESETQRLQVNVTGKKKLKLIVTGNDDGYNGDHAVWADARVIGTPTGNVTSVIGQWTEPLTWPLVAVHAHLLPDGRVLVWDAEPTKAQIRVWDPTTNTFTDPIPTTNNRTNVFCSGHSFLPDGRLLVTGGQIDRYDVGTPHSNIFDFRDNTWTAGPSMNAGRWYPTNTTLSNGDVLVISGLTENEEVNQLPQVWQTSTGRWRDLTTAQFNVDLYPWTHLAPNGKVFISGPSQFTQYIGTSGTGTLTEMPASNYGMRVYGSSVMYEPGKVLIVGGQGAPANTETAEVINLKASVPEWRYVSSMAIGRQQHNATILPNGTVMVTGGTNVGFSSVEGAVYAGEIWNPSTEKWSLVASMQIPHLYHSIALLLPDGRVLVAGGGQWGGATEADNRYQAEIYSPPYLFKGSRPIISLAPNNAVYNQKILVETPNAAEISKVTLVRLSSVTHAFNQEQRYIRLSYTQATGGLNVTIPASKSSVPPGYYMLFIINTKGVPSIAKIINIR